MFRTNAFGQRINCLPRLRFIDPPEGSEGGEESNEDRGFPAETPLEQMTVEQREAYHKYQSRKHEKAERELQRRQADFDKYKADSDELAQLKAKNATDEEKAIEEARREGENLGAQRYLKDAVKGRFQGLTGKTDDEVDTIFEHVDPLTFTDDQGDIVADKLKRYADTFGTKNDDRENEDPVAGALRRQRQAGGGSGTTISERRKQTRESLTRKTA